MKTQVKKRAFAQLLRAEECTSDIPKNRRKPFAATSMALAISTLLLTTGLLIFTAPASAGTVWNIGDVFAGVSGGTYQVYDNTGVFKETISTLSGFTTGCAFNPPLNTLYTTYFSETKVVAYADVPPHSIVQTIDTGATSPGGQSESIVFDEAGNFYVGHPDGNHLIHKYNAAGVLQTTFSAAIENRGTDWLDLASDQVTMFYTSEGRLIKRFDVGSNAQLTDFATLPGAGVAFALRLLPPGDGSEGLLVADSSDIKRLNGAGAVAQTYDATGENNWFSLNLDPNGQSFWAGDFGTSNFYRFDIATGAIEVGPINTGTGASTLFGICLKGEPTAGGRFVVIPTFLDVAIPILAATLVILLINRRYRTREK